MLFQCVIDSVWESWCLFFGGNRISSRTEHVGSYLTGIWTAEQQEPETDSDQDFQHLTNSCSFTMRVMVARASPVCSFIDR